MLTFRRFTARVPRYLTAGLLAAIIAVGALGLSATGASATVGDWNTSLVKPSCANSTNGGWWDFSDVGNGLWCSVGDTKVFSDNTVWLDQVVTRWTYNNGWHTATLSNVRYHAKCGSPNLSTLNTNNGDCSVVGHTDTWWHGPSFCNNDYAVPYCGDIHVNANDGLQNFVIEAGSRYQVQKTAWWWSGGRWVPKTVNFWMNDQGTIYSIQSS